MRQLPLLLCCVLGTSLLLPTDAVALPLADEPVLTGLPTLWSALGVPTSVEDLGVRAGLLALEERPELESRHAGEAPAPLARLELDWTVPAYAPWPLDEEGMPLVQTPRLDALYITLTRRFTPRWVRKRFKLSLERLMALNPAHDVGALAEGARLLVWERAPGLISRSVGSPNRGRLIDGEPLPPGDKYAIIYPHRTFGTYYTISEIVRVMSAYAVEFPEADPIMIGDVSLRGGGRMAPHLSHTSGRDVDMTYPRLTPAPTLTRFHPIARRELDVPRTLWILRAFIASGRVERVFIDRPIQRMLYEEAVRQGAPPEWLDAVFQYPGRGERALIIASPGHDDHFHIRFRCQPTDIRCE
jgi:murein endopeptidase